jgi:hypothetical protein
MKVTATVCFEVREEMAQSQAYLLQVGSLAVTEFNLTKGGEGRDNFSNLSIPFLFTTQIDRIVRRQSNTGELLRS